MDYTKLSALVDDKFKVISYKGFSWKKWDDENKKMLSSQEYVKGYSKKYSLETDKGILELGSGQLGSVLLAAFENRKSMEGSAFEVKSNGKTGMDIRYFFNFVKEEEVSPEQPDSDIDESDFDLPF